MISSFELSINHAIKKVIEAIELHERKEIAPLSIEALLQVKKELEEMIKVMDPNIYIPGYPRYILDWPDDDELIDELVNIAYQYSKIKKA